MAILYEVIIIHVVIMENIESSWNILMVINFENFKK